MEPDIAAGGGSPVPKALDIDGVADLYAVHPSEFVAARDDLVKRLRSAGDREGMAAVKALRRPTVVAWALNQTARTAPEKIDQLVTAGAALRDAQADAVSSGEAALLRDAGERRRTVIRELARSASELAGGAHHDEIVATLQRASLDADAADLLRRAQLTKELAAPAGFGLAEMPEPPERPRPSLPDRAELDRLERDRDEAVDAVASARRRLAEAHERQAAAAAEVDTATAEAARAGAALREAERALDDANR